MAAGKIAIIGSAYRLPGNISNDHDLWDALVNRKDLITEVDDSRFEKTKFYHKNSARKGKSYTFKAGMISDYDSFDASFFNIPSKEAAQMDPQQKILLELTWEAFENAGYNPFELNGKQCGVYVGIYDIDYSLNGAADLAALGLCSAMGGANSIAANRISYFFDLHGPSMSIDTACSSSLVAMHQACMSLKSGEIDMAIVGGINLFQHPMPFVALSKANILSPDGRCKSFSDSADGYARSEGCIVTVLKRLEQAEEDGDLIRGVLLNTASNSDGKTNGLPMPGENAQYELLNKVYNEIDLAPSEVTYIEAHGTGTRVGDPIEVSAISRALASRRKEKLPVGSIKSNMGHLEPAAGLAGLLKGLLCIKHRKIPATIHCEKLNPDIDFEQKNIKVINKLYSLKDHQKEIIIGINSFGFGGSNAHVILSEYIPMGIDNWQNYLDDLNLSIAVKFRDPDRYQYKKGTFIPDERKDNEPATFPPLLLTANSEYSLKRSAAKYLEYLATDNGNYYNIAYNLLFRRATHKYYLTAYGSDREEIITALKNFANDQYDNRNLKIATGKRSSNSGRTALVFTGNGCQWFGMGKKLISNDKIRPYMGEVDNIFRKVSGFSIVEKIKDGTDPEIYRKTEIAQPALFIIQVAVTSYLKDKGILFDAVIGHSVGEIPAAWACGALSLEEAVKLIFYKSKAQEATRFLGKMAVIGLSADDSKVLLRKLQIENEIDIAGINSPKLVTLSGTENSLLKVQEYCETEETFFQFLNLDYPFHSKLMAGIESNFISLLGNSLQPENTDVKFISTVYGKELSGNEIDSEYWWKNIREPVKFKDGIDYLLRNDFAVFVEIGTHPILVKSIEQCAEEAGRNISAFPSLKRDSDENYDLDNSLFKLWGSGAKWNNEKWFPFKAPKIQLPDYCWDKKKYRPSASEENNGIVHLKYEHPLLGWRIASEETIWENHIDATNCGDLKDHVVGNLIVFPAAGYMEMAVAANSLVNKSEICYIDNIQITAPFVLEENITHQMQFRLEKNGYFIIRSRPRLTDNNWNIHATGRIVEKQYHETLNYEKIELNSNPACYNISPEEHYNITGSVGLHYTNRFQTVNSILFSDNVGNIKLENKSDISGYIIGPSLIDGGLHSLISLNYKFRLLRGINDTSTYLPSSIEKLLFNGSPGKIVSAQIILTSCTETSIKADIVFRDKMDNIVLILYGFRGILADIVSTLKPPPFYEYKPMLLYSFNEKIINSLSFKTKNFMKAMTHITNTELYEINHILEQLLISYIVEGVKNIFPDKNINIEEYPEDKYGKLYWALSILLQEGYLINDPVTGFVWNNDKEILAANDIFKLLAEDYRSSLPTTLYLSRAGKNMGKILLGELTGEDAVPEKSGLYEELVTNSILLRPSQEGFKKCFQGLCDSLKHNERISILETGSGIFASSITDNSTRLIENIDYTLMTFDSSFIGKSIKNKINIHVHSIGPDTNIIELAADKKFNIILCSDLYLYNDLHRTLKDFNTLLKSNGLLIVNEALPCISQYVYNTLKPYYHGHLSGTNDFSGIQNIDWWKNRICDSGLRHIHTTKDFEELDSGRFTAVFEKVNPEDDGIKEDHNEDMIPKSVLLFYHKNDDRYGRIIALLSDSYRKVEALEYNNPSPSVEYAGFSSIIILPQIETDSDDIALDLFIMETARKTGRNNLKNKPELILLTTGGALCNDIPGLKLLRNPRHGSLWAFMRVVSNEFYNSFSVKMIDLQSADINKNLIKLLNTDNEQELIMTDDSVYSLKVAPLVQDDPRSDQETDKVIKLDLIKQGSLNNIQWLETDKRVPGKDEVAIQPVAVGLNFRDIMYSLGLIPEEVVEYSSAGPCVGLDAAGIVVDIGKDVTEFAVGDKVMGGASNSLGNYCITSRHTLMKLPPSWSFEEGATIFTVFLTAYYSLINVARLRKGEKLLIHGAAGGVGIAAIQLAKYIGAEVYATAGSIEKREFLKLSGVKHVYDSRSLYFVEQMLNDTAGEGVDVVLNSLAAEFIDANFKILRPFGRFIEMGKRDIYENYMIGLKPFRNNISYHCVNVEQIMLWKADIGIEIFSELKRLFDLKILKPLPYKIFTAEHVKDALKYLQKAKHIGKVVVDLNHSNLKPYNIKMPEIELHGTYLITGGTGGFGLDTAKWLVDKGVKKLILISRSGRIGDENLHYFESKNIEVLVRSADVSSYDQLKAVFDEIKESNIDLKGIVHAAAVYDDGLIENILEESYRKVLLTKIKGADYLDVLSRNIDLENFILYSSVTTFFGNIGQVNYVAANGYLESLALKRRSSGLKANYISMGGILDTGLLTRNTKLKKALTTQTGANLITVKQAFSALENLLVSDSAGFAAMEMNIQQMEKTLPIFKSSRFDILRLSEKKIYTLKNTDFREYIKELPVAQAKEELTSIVHEEIAVVLDIQTSEVNAKKSLKEYGFDSLMGFDLAVSLEKRIGISIPAFSFQQAPTAENITEMLLSRLLGDNEETDDIKETLYKKHGE